MSFPSSPSDGQTTTINGVIYTYSAGLGAWTITTAGSATIGSSVSGTLSVTGGTTLSSTLSVGGAATLSSTLGVTGAATLSSTLSVSGTSTLSGATTVSSTLQATSIGVGTTPNATTGQITCTNSITAFYSDMRLKENFEPITNPLLRTKQLSGVYYTQNKFAEQFGYSDYSRQVGVIAQDVEKVLPEVVKIAPFDMDGLGGSKSGERYLTIHYEKLVPLLIEAIKELDTKVTDLQNEVEVLKGNQ